MGIKRLVDDTTTTTIISGKKLKPDTITSDTLQSRLKHYNLDYYQDVLKHLNAIYDPKSKWFSRLFPLKFDTKSFLPYEIENHIDRARYICHILLNLYISISSLDIQGLININDKDIKNIQNGISDFINNTNLTQPEIDADLDDEEDEEEEENNEYIDLSGPDSNNAFGKITSENKCIINVNHWTNELKNCLDFNFPLSLRKSLVIVYYHLSMVQGQKIYRQLHVEIMEKLLDRHSHGTNFTELLKNDNLILDHTILFQLLCEFLPYPDSDYIRYDITSKDDLNLFRLLLKLSHMAKHFFNYKNQALLSQIMDTLLSSISPQTLPIVLPIITSFVPYHYHSEPEHKSVTDYIPFCFGLWSSTSANIATDTHMYDFIGNVLEDYHGRVLRQTLPTDISLKFDKYGLLNKDQMIFLFNRLQGHLRTNGQIHSFSRTVRPFIYSINGNDSAFFFEYLSILCKAIETFVHPSNSGFWTKPIAKFVHSFIKMYHGRVKREERIQRENHPYNSIMLTTACHDQMTNCFLEILFIGAQNKNPDIANYYISCFGYIADLKPKCLVRTMDRIIVELYDSLQDEYINSRHRIIASLKQFSRVVRFMVMDELYRVHIINILYMLTMKLDMNDINLTSNLVNGIVSIASFIPFEVPLAEDEYINFESNTLPFVEQHFYHLKSGNYSDQFKYDNDTLNAAFRGSTTILSNILRTYIDKLFKMTDSELDDGFITKLNQTTMIIIQTMDKKLFEFFTEQFTKLFWDNETYNEKNPNFEILTTCLAATVKRDESKSPEICRTLFFKVKEQIERGAGSVRSNTEIQRRDLKLVLYLTALNDVLRQSYESILLFSDELIEAEEYIFKNITNPPLDVITSILVHSTCATLTTTEIREAALFSQGNDLTFEEKWGALQFSDERFAKKNLDFKWHVPTEAEVELCIHIFTKTVNMCIEEIDQLLKLSNSVKGRDDKIQKYILILTHSLSGSSLLFDADYTKILNKKYTDKMSSISSESSSRFVSLSPYVFLDQDSDIDKDVGPDLATLPKDIDIKNPLELGNDKLLQLGNREDSGTASTSEAPSRIATPTLHREESPSSGDSFGGVNHILGTNDPQFKDLDIFAYNYFFGNSPSDKLNNILYHKINNERLHVGHFYHKIFKFLSDNSDTNINTYQSLLHGLKVWFTDIGKETIFNDDPNLNLEYDFLENIQSLRHLEQPFTRSLLAVSVNNLHQSRVLLHSTVRNPSKLELKLLNDIISLASSVYPDIHKPAQACLMYCMKQMIGSYSVVVGHLLKDLKDNLQKQQNMKIEVILKILCLRKIQRRLLSDYTHVQDVILMLLECYKINELDISLYAEKLLLDIVTSIKIPSSICVYDDKMYTPIDPCDPSITRQVELIKTCKNKKIHAYHTLLAGVQNKMISILNEHKETNWKIPTFIIQFISKLQASLEMKTSVESIEAIFDQTKQKHPEMVHLVVRSFLAISNKVISLSDYKYDISRAYQSTYDPAFVSAIDTSVKGGFQKQFKEEMTNFDNPNYFIDGKSYVGWLSWGRSMKVLKNDPIDINLEENETEIFKKLGKLITKEWLNVMMTCIIQDNETRCVFSSSDVSFIVVLIILITRNYTSNLKLSDLFDLCSAFYKRYDKASTIMSIELIAGMICGSRYLNPEETTERDEFIDKFMKQALNNEFNQDAFEIWGTLCWWLPSVVDIRRCSVFFKNFNDPYSLMDKSSEQFGNQASKILMLGSILMSMDFKTPNIDYIIENIVFDHPYDQVRESIGRLVSIISQVKNTPSFASVEQMLNIDGNDEQTLGVVLQTPRGKMDALIKEQFKKIELEYGNISGMTPQEILKTKYYYLSSTMFHWLQDLIRGTNKISIVPYIADYILPFLLKLMKEKDVCTLGGIDAATDFLGIAYLPLDRDQFDQVITLMCSNSAEENSKKTSYETKLKLAFIQHFISSQLLQLTDVQRHTILEYVVSQVYNETHVEVRIRAADVLSDIVHNLRNSDELTQLIKRFSDKLSGYTWEQKKQLSKTDVVIHGSVIALGAIISAFPYVFPLPRWMPQELSQLASWARTSGLAGRSAKDTISEFKKVRADTWKFDRSQFTTEELEDLEGVLWRSYYA